MSGKALINMNDTANTASKKRGKLIVVSGPSGVGKGTVCGILKKNKDKLNLSVSVSATTRAPRDDEKEGINYFFKTEDEFRDMVDNGCFLEWATYNDHNYGTPEKPVLEKLEKGINVLLEIDVQGALKVMEKYPGGVYVFISPPSIEELRNRLVGRGSESAEEIEKRVKLAEWEMLLRDQYDYIVVNDVLEEAVKKVAQIITA